MGTGWCGCWCRRAGEGRGGFTLVELLVVIAIIMMLAALALPVLQRAAGQARGAQCVSNLRQLNTAFRAYSTNFDSLLPATYGCGTPTWLMNPDPHRNWPLAFANSPQGGSLFPYYGDAGLVRCPSDREGNGKFSYATPINICFRVIDEAASPSDTPLVLGEHERWCIGGYYGSTAVPQRAEAGFACGDRPAVRHRGSGGVGYFDGRAALVRYEEGTVARDIEIRPWGYPCGIAWPR